MVIRLTVRMRQLGARCRQWRPQHGSTLCRQSQSNDRVTVGNSVKHAVGEIVGQNVDVRFNSSGSEVVLNYGVLAPLCDPILGRAPIYRAPPPSSRPSRGDRGLGGYSTR